MEKIQSAVYCLVLIISGIACMQKVKSSNIATTEDTIISTLRIDTIFQLEVDSIAYQLIITNDDYTVEDKQTRFMKTVRIVENKSCDTLYKASYDFNSIDGVQQTLPGHYWLRMGDFGGGSGFSGTLYKINFSPKIKLQPVFNYDELSFCKSNYNSSEIILFEGIWDMEVDDLEMESHFSAHKQMVSVYEIKNDTTLVKKIGETKFKYNLYCGDSELGVMRVREPWLFKKIRWQDYKD